MRISLLCIILFTAFSALGQRYSKLIYSFNTADTLTETRNGVTGLFYKHLEVYSTSNNLWNGPRLNVVYPVTEGSESWEDWIVELDNSHEDQFIFLLDTNVQIPLKKDSVYDLQDLSWRKNLRIRDRIQLMVVEKFDTTSGSFKPDTVDLSKSKDYCLCGTKYDGKIIALLQGVQPYDITTGAYIYSKPSIYQDSVVMVINDSIKADGPVNDSVHAVDPSWFKFGHLNTVFSNPDTNKYNTDTHLIEIHPFIPVNRRITIQMNTYGGVFLQPHTELVGSMYDSVNQIRHKVDISIEDGEVCVPAVVELVIKDENGLRLNGGQIALKSQRSCTMIRDKARLIFGENQDVTYGTDGIGILGLKPGCSVLFEKNATFTIDNMLLLSDYWEAQEGGSIDITLHEGNALAFGSSALVSNGPFEHGSVVLNIHLKGGSVDLEHLDGKSLELINIIDYSKLASDENIVLYPNPTSGLVNWSFKAQRAETAMVHVYDTKGRIVYSSSITIEDGINSQQIVLEHLAKGAYYLKLESASLTKATLLSVQ